MFDDIKKTFEVIWNDEELHRLLHYLPKNRALNIPDPLDPSLPNILDMNPLELYELQDELIKKTPKSDDLADKKICRLYIYLGNRMPAAHFRSFHTVTQEIHFDIICHEDYENGDFRSNRIADRINDLFALNRISGLGKTDYSRGNLVRVPAQYVGYGHVFEFGGTKS
ncbi:hypothetical protein [Cytobacillus gottheilii]|uniref:hypothetical protein n=1 Tax=Cytobacillus gottheilii TaxID=859144 RepID=UPI001119BFA6|nr:hypothetical protein [Cytobacillus gottheilii]